MVYFIQAESGPVKIGYSCDPKARLCALQTGASEKLRLLVAVDGTQELEAALHVYFVEKRLEGEWFELTSEDVVEIVAAVISGDFSMSSEQRRNNLAELAELLKLPQKGLDFKLVRETFAGRTKLFSDELAPALGYSQKQLSLHLRRFNIRPRDIRVGKRVAKGYQAADFFHIWEAMENPFIASQMKAA